MSAPHLGAVSIVYSGGVSGCGAAMRLKVTFAAGALCGLPVRRTGLTRVSLRSSEGGKGKRNPHRAFFAEMIAKDGGITKPELTSARYGTTEVRADLYAIGKFLRKPSYKKEKSSVAAKCRRAKVSQQREDWFKQRIPVVSAQPERVVFIGEISVMNVLPQLRRWALRGDRLLMEALQMKCTGNFTELPDALS